MKLIYHISGVGFIFGLLLFSRLYSIRSIPPAISHDEIYYPTQAKSLAISGSDPSGSWNPLSFSAADPLFAELPGVVMTPAFWLIPNDPILASKLTFAVLGSLLVLAIAGVGYQLTRSKMTAGLIILIASFNPWIFQFSRMGYDALFSLSFYFMGIWVLLATKDRYKLLSIPLFFLGFFQYQGLKLLFLPLLLGIISYEFIKINQRKISVKFKHSSIILLAFGLILTTWFFGKTLINPDQQRLQNDLIFTKTQKIESQVNLERQQAIKSGLTTLFTNKATVTAKLFASEYLKSFDFNQLFLNGEAIRNPGSVWRWGMFMPIDLLLLIFGWAVLISNPRFKKQAVLLGWMTLIAPLPSAINATGTWIMFRSSLLVPTFIIVMGIGFNFIYHKFPKVIFWAFLAFYLVFIAMFKFEYFFKYPVYGTQGKYFASRVIASYIERHDQNTNLKVLAIEPKFVFETYLTLANQINLTNLTQIQQAFLTDQFQLNQLEFDNHCLDISSSDSRMVLIADSAIPNCESDSGQSDKNQNHIAIPSLLDSGAIYTIYHDSLCSPYGLDRFAHVDANVFNVESLDDETFCKSFFIIH